MKNLVAKETADWFAQNVFVPGHDLLLTIMVERSNVKASINIDGPFHVARFFLGRPDEEDVIEPLDATRRHEDDPETNVHMHVVYWRDLNWCRVWYWPNPRIGYDCRICFFTTQPEPEARGPELFWFYAKSTHPLTKALPQEPRSHYSKPMPIPQDRTPPQPDAPSV
ncbi:MAG: hypothetical protein OJF51_004986 [Nitrospira sp.]|jgi:hypothetical protein|nr:MAG: hypothetical protein OJF51_004986 [Nitrospira sp.]